QANRVNLQDLLRVVVQAATAGTRPGSHTVRLHFASDPLWINGDRELLHHALVNLVRNAIQAMPTGGTVTVSAQPVSGDGQFLLAISDTAVWLTAEALKRRGWPVGPRRTGVA